MPYYQKITPKFYYGGKPPKGGRPIAAGKFPLLDGGDFGDIVGNHYVILFKQHARILRRDRGLTKEQGNAFRHFLSNTSPGRLLQPVKIVCFLPLGKLTEYLSVVFDNGASIMVDYLEAVLNHPTMTIHEAVGRIDTVSLIVDGELAGIVAATGYGPDREDTVTLWESPQP